MADVSQIAANGIDYDCKDAAARADIATLQSGLQTANGNITSLQNNISSINGDISSINGDISEINGDISALQTTVANIIESGAGYCKLSDGTLIRWGVRSNNDFTLVNNVLNTTVSWTDGVNFTSASSYRVFLTPGRNCIAYLTSPPCESQTNGNQSTRAVNSFEISAKGTSNSVSISWLAVGRWK